MGVIIEKLEHLMKLIIRKDQKKNQGETYFTQTLLGLMKESTKIHLSKAREILANVLNQSFNFQEDS